MNNAATLRVERYEDAQASLWDDFARASKNATFLFQRGYMDYHRDRFTDFSLVVYDGDQVVALLPAHRNGDTLISHGGLTYGGFVTDAHMKTPLMFCAFDATLTYCRDRGISGLRYKTIPHIYTRLPAQEDLYALFLCGAQLAERSITTVIRPQERIPLPKGRRYSVNKARKHGLSVRRDDERLPEYWALLEQTLDQRHHSHPVHSLTEIDLLRQRFPDHIQLYTCADGEELVGGVVIFESACVARTQYIAVSERGRELCALDLIIDHLLNDVFARKPYFDFGTSVIPATGKLNAGLIEQKESFGGRAVVQDTYWIDIEHWNPERIRQALT